MGGKVLKKSTINQELSLKDSRPEMLKWTICEAGRLRAITVSDSLLSPLAELKK
jgi:hypothetical protein